jgi:anti-anti-sigma factor
LEAAPEFARGLELLNGQGCVIDLSGCTFFDSSGIRLLVGACQQGASVVCPAAGELRRVFEIVSIEKSCRLFETLEEGPRSSNPGSAG